MGNATRPRPGEVVRGLGQATLQDSWKTCLPDPAQGHCRRYRAHNFLQPWKPAKIWPLQTSFLCLLQTEIWPPLSCARDFIPARSRYETSAWQSYHYSTVHRISFEASVECDILGYKKTVKNNPGPVDHNSSRKHCGCRGGIMIYGFITIVDTCLCHLVYHILLFNLRFCSCCIRKVATASSNSENPYRSL